MADIQVMRTKLVFKQPFYGTILLHMKYVEDLGIRSTECDGLTIRYHPKFTKSLTDGHLTSILAQHVLHYSLLHTFRRGNRIPALWDLACDVAIRTLLVEGDFFVPNEYPYFPECEGLSAEVIYDMLKPRNLPDYSEQSDSSIAVSSSGTEQETKSNIMAAAQAGKRAGKLPAYLERQIFDMLTPVLPWQELVLRFFTRRKPANQTWSRPNRRFVSRGLMLPSEDNKPVGKFVVGVDTSGSITKMQLTEFGNNLRAAAEDLRPEELHVVYCDAAVQRVDVFRPGDPIELHFMGGGGTSFRPVFDYLQSHQIVPDALAYLTDGYGDFPKTPAEFPTLWCINNDNVVPPWGEYVRMRGT